MNELLKNLLAADEREPVTVYNADGKSRFLLVADYAGNIVPRALRAMKQTSRVYLRRQVRICTEVSAPLDGKKVLGV